MYPLVEKLCRYNYSLWFPNHRDATAANTHAAAIHAPQDTGTGTIMQPPAPLGPSAATSTSNPGLTPTSTTTSTTTTVPTPAQPVTVNVVVQVPAAPQPPAPEAPKICSSTTACAWVGVAVGGAIAGGGIGLVLAQHLAVPSDSTAADVLSVVGPAITGLGLSLIASAGGALAWLHPRL